MMIYPSSSFLAEQYRCTGAPPIVHCPQRPRAFSVSAFLGRLSWECREYYAPPPALGNKKTLVLDLDGTLIHSSQFPPHASVAAFLSGSPQFYVFQRPGLDNFLSFIRQRFDVFVFTHGAEEYARPILDRVMPWVDASHRLYRESCDTRSGVRKNLKIFERSKKQLILVDDSNTALQINPKNTIPVPTWAGVPSDRVLIEWLPRVLEECAGAEDVRPVIRGAQGEAKARAAVAFRDVRISL
jgi:Dullard-like phosphatase family protein